MTTPTTTNGASLYRLTATTAVPSSATLRGTATITESIEQSDSDDATISLLDLLRGVA